MFDDDELKSMMKLSDRKSLMRMKSKEERHAVDGNEWFVRMESHSFIEPNTSLCCRS